MQVEKSKQPAEMAEAMAEAMADYRLIKSPGFLLFLAGFLLS
jgi:hypothetical protein